MPQQFAPTRKISSLLILSVAGSAMAIGCFASADEAADRIASKWPQFRGPNGAAVSTDQDLPASWGPDENIVWKTELPGATDGLLQETVAPVVHDHPATAGSDTKVVPAGRVSLQLAEAASLGPLLVTVMV